MGGVAALTLHYTLYLIVLQVCTGEGKRLHTLPSHPVLGDSRGLSLGR